ncbi:uncharacterized protein [Diadema antillarum]|uniref:uncharacterized protein n=1 Tax=Diadema antillarum TaxID=105358 RepID=UPI003A85243E
MGSGSSKTKSGTAPKGGPKNNVVVAEVVVPNQAEPVKITGQLSQTPPPKGSGQAVVKEIGPNKFSLQMGDESIGTFEASGDGASGDFSSYLANAASLTVQNIETVAEEEGGDSKMASKSSGEPLVIQLKDSNDCNDDVEWEEVIQDIGDQPKKKSSRGIDLPDSDATSGDRKSRLKEALRSKHATLSPQEYEQMIANHRQEVDLMNLLREKEKERQKFSLASKVAERKKRRKAKQAFTEQDGDGLGGSLELANTARYQELQEQIAQQRAKMEAAQESVGSQGDGGGGSNESEKIMEAYKKQMAVLEEELRREKEQRQQDLQNRLRAKQRHRKAKQAAEKKRQSEVRNLPSTRIVREMDIAANTPTAEQVQADIAAKEAAFQREVESKKNELRAEEYQRLLAQHKREIEELSGRLNLQHMRQQQNLQDKLNARLSRRQAENTEKEMTAAELQRLEAELRQRQQQFEAEMKERRGSMSEEEYRRLIAAHKQELAELQHKLDVQRDRQQQRLLDKLAARRAKRADRKEQEALITKIEAQMLTVSDPEELAADPAVAMAMDADEVKELQLAISKKQMTFSKMLPEIRSTKSKAEAQKFIDQHRQEMEEMQLQLDLEKARMKAALMAKLQARRKKHGDSHIEEDEPAMSAEEIKQLQIITDEKEADFKRQQKSAKKEMSQADYQKFLDDHKRNMQGLNRRLELERMRMEQELKNKMAARRFRRPDSAASVKSQRAADMQQVENDIEQKRAVFAATVEARKSEMSKEEYERLLAQHRQEMEDLQKRLDRARARQDAHFQDKLDARRRRRKMWESEEEERRRLMAMMNAKDQPLSREEFNNILEDVLTFDEEVLTDIQDKKKKVSAKEYQKMLDDHKKNMDALEQNLLDKGKGRNEEITDLEEEIRVREAAFQANVEAKKSGMSKEEYERLLKQHQQEMEDLRKRLDRSKVRQEAHLRDKLEARRRRRRMMENEEEERRRLMQKLDKDTELNEEEFDDLEDDLKAYGVAVAASIDGRRAQLGEAEYERLMTEHRKNMATMNELLEDQFDRMTARRTNRREMRGNPTTNMVKVVDDSDEETGSEEEDVSDLQGLNSEYQSTQFASTTLWTTPTQSNDVVIVPLREEYPVKRKRELYTDPAIFRQIDAHAIRLAQTVSLVTQPTFSALVNELTEFGTTELQKVRLIFRWLTAQNCDEMDLNDVIDDTPLGVLKGLYHKKITFSTLFMRMCRFIGIQCVEIVGIAKVKGYRAGQSITPKEMEFHHTWNAVRIDGFWHFVDCNWGVSHIAGSVTYDPFRFEYDEHYFLADPDVIIYSHFPNDPAWQLLKDALTLEQFNNQVLLKPDFFKFGFGLMNQKTAVIDVLHGSLSINVQCPQGFLLSCRLSRMEDDRDVTRNGIPFDLYEFIHQISDTAMDCFIRFPETGNFNLTIYAKRQYLDGELNLESHTEICRYLVRCHAPSNDTQPLPYSPADHWGPIGTMNAGLVPITHRSSVAISDDGSDFNIRFKRQQQLRFSHHLTCHGIDDRRLLPYAIGRNVEDELVFTVTPPHPGRYALNINVHYPGLPKPAHLCSYLLVAARVRQNLQPMPLLNNEAWGPTQAFSSLGLSTFTHPDPFFVTSDVDTEITVGTRDRIFMQHMLYHKGEDATQFARPQFGDGFVTFVLQLPYPGYFHLKLVGKDTQDPSIPSTVLFNYLIRRD